MRAVFIKKSGNGTFIALTLFTVSTLTTACLLPAPFEEDEAALENFGPQITYQNSTPNHSEVFTISKTCQNYIFTIDVDDPDDDEIFYRILTDYSESKIDVTRSPALSYDVTRRERLQFFLKHGDFLDDTPDEPHILEVYFVDRPFADELLPFAKATSEGSGAEDALIKWTIQLTEDEDPECPLSVTP